MLRFVHKFTLRYVLISGAQTCFGIYADRKMMNCRTPCDIYDLLSSDDLVKREN